MPMPTQNAPANTAPNPLRPPMAPYSAHPLDSPKREQVDEATRVLEQYITPGVRKDNLKPMFETLGSEFMRKLIVALQGVPLEEFPMGR